MTTEDLQLSRLQPSPVHLRRGKDKVRDAELLESVKRHGVLQPVLVRPLTDGAEAIEVQAYEIVAGHRRYQAAKSAKLETIPVLVRVLTDAEALELQVVENQQRSDVHPLEEAEGYRLLTEKHGYTVEQIAAKVGKSRAYVYGRMKLGALGRAGRTAFLDGKLDAAMALLVARIPEALQAKALEEIQSGGGWDMVAQERGCMTYRAAAEFVQTHYMLRLADAPFDTAVSELTRAGACGPCPKRTGNQAELFGDVKGPDICTDPVCYYAKVYAAARQQRLVLEAEGKTILSAAQAKKLYRADSTSLAYNAGYKQLDDEVWVGERQVKVAALLRKHLPDASTVYCQRPDGVLVELATEKDVQRAAAKARPKAKGPAKTAARKDPKAEKREAERQRREARAALVGTATLALVIEKLPKAKDDALWKLLAPIVEPGLTDLSGDALETMFARYGAKFPTNWNQLPAVIRELVGSDVGKARAIVLESILLAVGTNERNATLRELVKLLRITPDQVKRRANAEQAAATERAKQEKAKAGGAGGEAEEDEAGEEGGD